MIICFSGTPGSGKSYDAVRKIIDNIKLGRKVYTNVEGIEQPRCREYIKAQCDITDFQIEKCLIPLTKEQAEYPEQHCEKKSLVVLDEVHKLFSNRDWQTIKNKEFNEWASTHRHDGYDLILITQGIDKLDKHLRTLIEWTYFYRKLNMFGSMIAKHRYIVYTYGGDQESGNPLSKKVKKYDPRIFGAYQSFTDEEIKEVGFMTHTNVFKHPVFMLLLASIVLAGYFAKDASFMRGDLFGYKIDEKEEGLPTIPVSQEIKQVPSKIHIQEYTEVVRHVPAEEINPFDTGRMRMVQKADGSYMYTNLKVLPHGGRLIKLF